MMVFSTLSRAGVAAASLLLCGALLVVPTMTYEPTVLNAAAAAQVAATPATTTASEAPTTLRGAAAGPSRTGRAHEPHPPGAAGMVVGIDPETGELGMPTPEQMQKISDSQQNQVDHSPAGLVEVHHPDGSVSIDLQGRFQEYATVRIGPDGKLIYQCVDGEENARRAVAAPAPPASEER